MTTFDQNVEQELQFLDIIRIYVDIAKRSGATQIDGKGDVWARLNIKKSELDNLLYARGWDIEMFRSYLLRHQPKPFFILGISRHGQLPYQPDLILRPTFPIIDNHVIQIHVELEWFGILINFYTRELRKKQREILTLQIHPQGNDDLILCINDHVLHVMHYNKAPRIMFEYLLRHANHAVNTHDLVQLVDGRTGKIRTPNRILDAVGIRGLLRKAFIDINDHQITLFNPVTMSRLIHKGIRLTVLRAELQKLDRYNPPTTKI